MNAVVHKKSLLKIKDFNFILIKTSLHYLQKTIRKLKTSKIIGMNILHYQLKKNAIFSVFHFALAILQKTFLLINLL